MQILLSPLHDVVDLDIDTILVLCFLSANDKKCMKIVIQPRHAKYLLSFHFCLYA